MFEQVQFADNTQYLLDFLNSHYPPIPATYDAQRNKLLVHCEFVCANGEHGIESSYIQPTLKAVRAYLGY